MKYVIESTVGQYWFKLHAVGYPDPSKLPKGSLSIRLVPVDLPEGCQVVSGLPAALIIARAVGDNTGIEWMAVEAAWKQALCECVLQMDNLPSAEWIQLLDHGTTAIRKQRTVDGLRQLLSLTPQSPL